MAVALRNKGSEGTNAGSKSRKKRAPKWVQTTLIPLVSPRKGIGGRPTNEKRGLEKATSHRKRDEVSAAKPLHVTIKLVKGLPMLRKTGEWHVLRGCIAAMRDRVGFRLCHYSTLTNHMHLIIEADDLSALSRGMQSLQTRMARGLNKLWKRKGKVFRGRFHAVELGSPNQLRWALNYVLNNARRHGVKLKAKLDEYASGGWFDGWRESDQVESWSDDGRLVDHPRSWLLRTGWRKQRGKGEPHEGLAVFAIPVGAK